MYEGRDFCLCGVADVDGSSDSGGADGNVGSAVFRSMFLVCGRAGLFKSVFFMVEGDIFELDWGRGGFVVVVVVVEVEVKNFELVMGCIVRLALRFLNGRGHFL